MSRHALFAVIQAYTLPVRRHIDRRISRISTAPPLNYCRRNGEDQEPVRGDEPIESPGYMATLSQLWKRYVQNP
ncbi:MAG: hypothetical protein WBQ37_06710 [Candidatus Competibacter sp.]